MAQRGSAAREKNLNVANDALTSQQDELRMRLAKAVSDADQLRATISGLEQKAVMADKYKSDLARMERGLGEATARAKAALRLGVQIELPANRVVPGTLRIVDGDSKLVDGPFPVLGKAENQAAALHGNPTRNPLEPFGDTPCGDYEITRIVPQTGITALHTYGPYVLELNPVSGQALEAFQESSRLHDSRR